MVGRIPAKRVLRLRAQGLSGRAIATSQGVARKSVAAVLEASDRLGVSWEDVADREDADVYELLFPGRGEHRSVFVQLGLPARVRSARKASSSKSRTPSNSTLQLLFVNPQHHSQLVFETERKDHLITADTQPGAELNARRDKREWP